MTYKTKRFFLHLGRDALAMIAGGIVGLFISDVGAYLAEHAIGLGAVPPGPIHATGITFGALLGLTLYLVRQMIQRAADRIRIG